MTDRRQAAPDVTVIVAACNHSAYVAEALDSILAQTRRPCRVVVGDDASTNDSVAVIRRWMEQHRDVDVRTVFHRVNTGLCAILNEALALVETPLYAHPSTNDRMFPHCLEVQVERWLQRHPRPRPGTPTRTASTSSAGGLNPIRARSTTGSTSAPAAAICTPRSLGTSKSPRRPSSSTLVQCRASAATYNEEWFYEDHDLWLRARRRAGGIVCMDGPLVEIRELASSLGSTGSGSGRHLAARLGIQLDQLDQLDPARRLGRRR